MRVGIDASNLRQGGGVTHLVELLREAWPYTHGIEEVVVYAGGETLDKISPRPWLRKAYDSMLDQPLPVRTYWQYVRLPQLARQDCDVLFAPGGRVSGSFKPVVTMSRNLLPFESAERRRYGVSRMHLKLLLLRGIQTRSFRIADGVIFLNQFARSVVMDHAKKLKGQSTIIPHGIGKQFQREPIAQRPLSAYSKEKPIHLLYVSIVDLYKHQWNVVEAVSLLRRQGMPIQLNLVGPAYPPAMRYLLETMARLRLSGKVIRYHGSVPYSLLPEFYHQADIAVFASSCENMPNILLEAMAAGLPIACSSRGPMPSVLGDAGTYFDPEQPREIADALALLIGNRKMRETYAHDAYQRSQVYSWERCAEDTFAFIAEIARAHAP